MSKYRKFAIRGAIAGAAIALMAIVGTVAGKNTSTFADTLPRDCDATSIIDCGATTIPELESEYAAGGTKIHYNDLTAIYQSFGISDAAIKGLGNGQTQWAWGQIHADGTVWMNGQQIASNALTAGRRVTANSVAIPGTGAYTRPPSDSFARPTTVIDMFIGFVNGKPAWGIITSCGNPVKWPTPNTTVSKQVSTQDQTAWTKDATYTNGNQVGYLLTVKNSGTSADTNVTIIDKLPDYQTYVPGSTKINNVANVDGLTTTGLNLGTINAGQTVFVTYRTQLSVPAGKCGNTDMVNTVYQDSDKGGPHGDTATTHTNVTCIVVSCNALSGPDAITLGDTATYIASASANGTTISSYAFTVDGQVVQNTTSSTLAYTPTTAGTHNVSVAVHFADGSVASGNGACAKPLTVKPKDIPQPKIVSCKELLGPDTLSAGQSGVYTANATDASLVASYHFTVNGAAVTASGNNLNYTFANPGTYKIAATVTPIAGVTDGGSAACVKTVTVKEIPQVITSCDALDATPSTITLGQTSVLKAHATASHTTVTSYNFTVDGQSVQSSASDTFNYTPTTAGTHNVAVKVTFANGDVKGGEGVCAKTITVTEVETPIYSCDLLTLDKTVIKDGDKVTATVKYTASNGATFSKAVVNFGEASVTIPTALNGTFSADYTYKTAKDYNVTATVTFVVDGKSYDVTSTNCAAKVTTTPIEMCKIPGKEQYPANDARCNDVKGAVTVLPNTGAGNMLGLFAGVTIAGAVLHNLLTRRAYRR